MFSCVCGDKTFDTIYLAARTRDQSHRAPLRADPASDVGGGGVERGGGKSLASVVPQRTLPEGGTEKMDENGNDDVLL